MISLIIPLFNEEYALEKLFLELNQFTENNSNRVEVILVDDASTDETFVKLEKGIKQLNQNVNISYELISNPANLGYGASIKRGIRKSQFSNIAIMDADLTYSFTDLNQIITLFLNEKFDMVVGARVGKFYEGNTKKKILRRILRRIVEYMSDQKIPDINSGLRIFRKKYVSQNYRLLSDRFSFTTSLTLVVMLNNGIVKYTQISYDKRSGGSKVRLTRDSIKTLGLILAVSFFYNPLKITYPILLLTSFISIFVLVLSLIHFSLLLLTIAAISFFSTVLIFILGLISQLLSMSTKNIEV
jgi:glycosyltransferase involved in cell wall biosynthesis